MTILSGCPRSWISIVVIQTSMLEKGIFSIFMLLFLIFFLFSQYIPFFYRLFAGCKIEVKKLEQFGPVPIGLLNQLYEVQFPSDRYEGALIGWSLVLFVPNLEQPFASWRKRKQIIKRTEKSQIIKKCKNK